MTRMYLAPSTTTFVKVCLVFVECFIELFNLITLPLRKMSFKAYICVSLISGVLHGITFGFNLKDQLVAIIVVMGVLAAAIFTTRFVYKILKKKVSPKVAYLINSPMGIPLNRFYKVENVA